MTKLVYRPDIDLYVRSYLEANVARIFHSKGIKFEYEPTKFELQPYGIFKETFGKDIITYMPDFKLKDGLWVEVKGTWEYHDFDNLLQSLGKICLFMEQHDNNNKGLFIVQSYDLDVQRVPWGEAQFDHLANTLKQNARGFVLYNDLERAYKEEVNRTGKMIWENPRDFLRSPLENEEGLNDFENEVMGEKQMQERKKVRMLRTVSEITDKDTDEDMDKKLGIDKWPKRNLYLSNGAGVNYLVCKSEENVGYPPIFLDSYYNGPHLDVGHDLQNKRDLETFVKKITFETSLDLNSEPAKILKKLQLALPRTPLPWSFFSKNKEYLLGYYLGNFFEALKERKDDLYQFNITSPIGSGCIEIKGRVFPKGEREPFSEKQLVVDIARFYSLHPDNKDLEGLVDEEVIGRPKLSHFTYFEHDLRTDGGINLAPEYLAGVWTWHEPEEVIYQQSMASKGVQPSIGIFGVSEQDREKIDIALPDYKPLPRIQYEGLQILPICYGVSSAVCFIRKTGKMRIERFNELLDDSYCFPAKDIE